MLPQLNRKTNQIDLTNSFLGINKKFKIENNEFEDTLNMTNDYFPILGNREKRGIIKTLTKPQAMLGGKYLCYVDNNALYYNDELITTLEATDNDRQLVMMGALLCVFPDGLIYNTYTKEISHIENEVTTTTPPTLTLCKLDGTKFNQSNTVTSDTEPTDKTKYWIDTSQDNVVIKLYSQSTSMWVSVGTTYIKIESTGIGKGFKAYDAVLFDGIDKSSALYNGLDLNQNMIVFDAADNYLVVAGLMNQTFTNSKNVTVKRRLPKMDYVCELSNRIWGCSSENHEVYACKLGDPTNWYDYAGLDSDSYAATIGTEDVFTGAISYQGYVFFFKENGYHKVYGTKPSNFEIIWKPCRGVQNGSEKSLQVVNEVLVYKARDSVCMFDGSVSKISERIDSTTYYDAVAGTYRDKYYISMRDDRYNYYLYVYDTTKGTWIQEDNTKLLYAVLANGGLYLLTSENRLLVVNSEKIYTKKFPKADIYPGADSYPGDSVIGQMEDNIEWSFTTGDIGDDSPYHKYIKRIDMRLWLDISAYMKIEIMYDSSEQWLKVMEYYCTRKKSIDMPISIQRCDHFKLRVSGHGDMKLYSLAKVTETGTDLGGDSNA